MQTLDPILVAIGLAGGTLLMILVLSLVQRITGRIRAQKRQPKVKKIASNLVAQKSRPTRQIPRGAKCFVFNDSGEIVHEDSMKLTKAEIRSYGGSGQLIAINRKIARIKWQKLFGNPTCNP